MDGVYLYCIMNGNHEAAGVPPAAMAGSSRVEILRADRLSAVVSPVEGFEVVAEQEVLLRRLAAHQAVIEHFMAGATVLPVKFGTVLASADEVLAMLARSESELTDGLALHDGFIEADVAVTWADMKKVFGDLATHPEIRTMRAEVEQLDPEARMDGMARVGKRVKELLDQEAMETSRAVLEALHAEAWDVAENELRDDSMLLNAAFLISRKADDRFTETLAELSVLHDGELDFRLIGPLPPYSFATVLVHRQEADTLMAALDTLELPHVASLREVRKAYRQLGRVLHPDHNSGDPEARRRFEEVNRAYLVIEEHLLDYPCRFTGEAGQTAHIAELRRRTALPAELSP